VTPHLNESDDVRLDVSETISDLTGDPPQGTLGTIDYVERAATTTLTVKDGHTAVIGGLVRNRVLHSATKVPLLGDIPILGALFRSTKDSVTRDNLVLVLTPHIIRSEDDKRHVFEAHARTPRVPRPFLGVPRRRAGRLRSRTWARAPPRAARFAP
jgi:general secretion pathway protein D